MDAKKFLIITWLILAFLIGAGVGYLMGVNGLGQRAQMNPPSQGGPAGQGMMNQPGTFRQSGNFQPPTQNGTGGQGTLNQGTPQTPPASTQRGEPINQNQPQNK